MKIFNEIAALGTLCLIMGLAAYAVDGVRGIVPMVLGCILGWFACGMAQMFFGEDNE
jgi:hypothetical protein